MQRLYFRPISLEDNISPYNSGKTICNIISKLIYATNNNDVKNILDGSDYKFDIFNRDPFVYRPKYLHHRIRNQHGLFSISMAKTGYDHEDKTSFILSPDTGCVYLGNFPKNFFKDTRIFSCVSEDEEKNIEKMKKFIQITENSMFNDILMYVKKSGHIDFLWTKTVRKLTSEEKIKPQLIDNIDTYLSEFPAEVKDFNKERIYGIITWFLRDKQPYYITKTLNSFKKNMKEPYFDLASSQGIFKILIPTHCKVKLRKQLQLMGINYSLLYPEPSNFFKGFSERRYPLGCKDNY